MLTAYRNIINYNVSAAARTLEIRYDAVSTPITFLIT